MPGRRRGAGRTRAGGGPRCRSREVDGDGGPQDAETRRQAMTHRMQAGDPAAPGTGASDMATAEGRAPQRQVGSARPPPARWRRPGQAVAGSHLDGLEALGALRQLEFDRLASSRLR